PRMVLKGMIGNPSRAGHQFDICLCVLAFDELFEFTNIFNQLRTWMAPGGKVVVFHHNPEFRSLDDWTYRFTQTLFPTIGISKISLPGSRPSALAIKCFRWAVQTRRLS